MAHVFVIRIRYTPLTGQLSHLLVSSVTSWGGGAVVVHGLWSPLSLVNNCSCTLHFGVILISCAPHDFFFNEDTILSVFTLFSDMSI